MGRVARFRFSGSGCPRSLPGRGVGNRNSRQSTVRLFNVERHVAIACGEIWPVSGTSKSRREVRPLVVERSPGKFGDGIPIKESSLKWGAYPPKNALGRTGTVQLEGPLSNQSERDVSPGKGASINLTIFPNSELVTASWISRTRWRCSSPAMTLSSSSGEGGLNCKEAQYLMTIGKDGQQSSVLLTGVPCVHRSHRSRRRGDASTIFLHFRHTCISVSHFQGRSPGSWEICR